MLRLTRDSAPYTELDFPKFNAEGFRRIQHAVEMAQQQRAFAQTADEVQQAAAALRMAAERKSLEQQIAQKNFEIQRNQTFERLKALRNSYHKATLKAPRRLEVETRIDHLVTLFNLKDFDTVLKQISGVQESLNERISSVRFPTPRSTDSPQSATALFLKAQQTEKAGDVRRAVELYGQVLERNPRHFQAIHRLNRLTTRGRRMAV
jgi:tetratricopeptide (TPR) repeat protein